jgi:hypothetical protein
MESKRIWVARVIRDVTHCDAPSAEMLIERLMEEGLLTLGFGNSDVDKVVQKFTDTFGTTKVTRQDRYAAHRMATKYGSQAVVGIIQLLASKNTEKYAPVVGSVAQLEDKFVSVMSFLRKCGEEDVIDA